MSSEGVAATSDVKTKASRPPPLDLSEAKAENSILDDTHLKYHSAKDIQWGKYGI